MTDLLVANNNKSSDVAEEYKSFAVKYRPERFEDVYGQEYPVRYLSSLIQRRAARNLLLHGTVGSGKTSLVRIFAKGLNCRNPADSGSPCGTCDRCEAKADRGEAGLYEYDVSGRGGDISKIKPWVDDLNRTPRDYKYRVLFFDEAHRLEDAAADFLLKAVEEPQKGVVFCFATTEFGMLRRALRSRLHDLEVRPLSIPLAIGFLQRFADKEGISCQPEALLLLAGLKEGYPRDLLNGLEQVCDPEAGIVTVERVRAVFDVDQTDMLIDYFMALAEGHLAHQTELMVSWREPAREKVRWLRAFLTSLYFNDILSMKVTVDAVIHSITAVERAPIIKSFCDRLDVAGPSELARFWRAMMNFWKDAGTDLDEAAIMLRIALFHDFVNDELPRLQDRPGQPGAAAGLREPTPVAVPSTGFLQDTENGGGSPRYDANDDDADDDPAFFRAADARDIINRASFFVQEYGVLFNAAFEVHPSVFGAYDEADGVKLVRDLCAELGQQVRIWDAEGIFAHLTVFEGDEIGLRALVVAHLPRLSKKGRGIDCVDRAAEWLHYWRRDRCSLQLSAIHFHKAPTGADAALRFHWKKTLELCAGLSGSVEDWDPRIGQRVPLLELLKIPSERMAQPVLNHPLIHTSDNLQLDAIATACAWMKPLSAFDAKKWDWIRKGWEQQEYFDRRATKKERRAKLAEHQQMHGINTPEADMALDRLTSSWPSKPEQRRRNWRGWWEQSEV